MKFLFPIVLAVVLGACSTVKPEPKPGTVAHQQWLHEQAREHFLALKAEEQKRRPIARQEPPPPTPKPARFALRPFFKGGLKPTPTPAPRLAQAPARVPKPAARVASKPKPTPVPAVASNRRRPADDTLYIWNAPRRQDQPAERFTAGEIRYARELAKRPENLSSEERLWARRRYR